MLCIGRNSEFRRAVVFLKYFSINTGAIFFMGDESISPAGFICLNSVVSFSAGNSPEIEFHFCPGSRNLQRDSVVTIVLRAMRCRYAVPALLRRYEPGAVLIGVSCRHLFDPLHIPGNEFTVGIKHFIVELILR